MRKERKVVLFSVLAISVIIGGFALVNNTLFAKGVDQQALQISDLPEGSQLLNEGAVDIGTMSHPLSLGTTPDGLLETPTRERQVLYEYGAAHSFSAIVPPGVVVANFLYQYPDQSQAEQAARLLGDELGIEAKGVPLGTFESKDGKGLRGQAAALVGDEGDSIYWFVGVKDNVLFLVMANGMDESSVGTVFESSMQSLLQK